MSPSELAADPRTAVLEGEASGPAYGATTVGQPLQALGQATGMVNGVGSVELGLPSETITGPDVASVARTQQTRTHAQHAPSLVAHSQLPLHSSQAAAASADGLVSPLPVVEQVQQHVAVGEVTFSPPEELPVHDGDRFLNGQGQPVWMVRLGEFLQRRVTQAGALMTPLMEARASRSSVAPNRTPLRPPRSWSGGQSASLFTPEAEHVMQQWASQAPLLHGPSQQQGSDSSSGSLTREQILQEVQRQVSIEMMSFSQQQAELEAENQRLRRELDCAVQARNAQVRDLHEGQERGNPAGPQGSATQIVTEGRDGNPPGPCLTPPKCVGVPRGRQLDPHEQGCDPPPVAGSLGVSQGDLGRPPAPDNGRRGDLYGVSGDLLLSASDPLRALGGQGQQPPPSAWLGGGSGGGQGSQASSAPNQEPPTSSQGASSRPADPLGLLVQGMTQLQNAVSESLRVKAKEPELVKPGVTELPKLPELSESSAIDVGDRLHGLQNHMGDLSNGSGLWWREVLSSLAAYYEAYMRASHVGKLSLRPEDYEVVELKDPKWSRVDKRASSMLLACVPESVREELLASRVSGTLAILARVIVLCRPGSVVERQQILSSLENPPQATTAAEAVMSLRRWARWMSRARDLGIQCPDPSVLLRGLDLMCAKPLQTSPEISFRINLLRYNLEIDVRPTERGVKDLHQALV